MNTFQEQNPPAKPKNYIQVCLGISFVYFLTLLPYILSIQYGGDPEPIHQAEFTRYISKIFPEESIVFIIY